VTDSERRKRGMQMFDEVYGGIVPFPPEHLHDDFLFNNVDQLFAEVWARPAMPIRERRLFIMGIICAQAEEATFEIQVRAALHKGELTPSDIRELITILPYYVGYPKATRMRYVTQRVLAEVEKNAAE
jgi:4-carboxymuconolactone decarboxylase